MVYKHWKITILCVASLSVTMCCNTPSKQAETRNIPVEFRNGDIAFRRGSGLASNIVLQTNRRGSFSHVGVIMNIDNEWQVVHEVPDEGESRMDDKIYAEPIGEFFNTMKAASGAVYRLSGIDSASQEAVCRYLEEQLRNNTLFDHKYDLADSSKLYCSELVWHGFLRAGIDITKGSRTMISFPGIGEEQILPADIEYNEDLELMYRF